MFAGPLPRNVEQLSSAVAFRAAGWNRKPGRRATCASSVEYLLRAYTDRYYQGHYLSSGTEPRRRSRESYDAGLRSDPSMIPTPGLRIAWENSAA